MKYIPSINIEVGIDKNFQYIVTPNTKNVIGDIVTNFHNGIHAQTIIGTYGTGKSSFLAALERDLISNSTSLIKDKNIFAPKVKNFRFLKVIGDYASMKYLLSQKLGIDTNADSKSVLDALHKYYDDCKKKGDFLFILVDEFGKVLEHAAKENPEEELYFMQKLAEFVNVSTRNIILLCTLHQNFTAYARKLDSTQRDEWNKVKGRFAEIVFTEPIEQILLLASQHIKGLKKEIANKKAFEQLFQIAKHSKIVATNLSLQTAELLYPLDPISATCLTLAIQRYGQNERTLFSFLTAKGEDSFQEFQPTGNYTFNLANVYDYSIYHFYSFLSEANADSMKWRAIRNSIERAESGVLQSSQIKPALLIIKSIGLLNLFSSSNVSFTKDMLLIYAKHALGINNAEEIIKRLEVCKIIRFAAYKSQYILFEGTDINIEDALLSAASSIPIPQASISELNEFITPKVTHAVAEYYRTGTPRYFEFVPTNEPLAKIPIGDLDGFVQLVFPLEENILRDTIELSKKNEEANLYAFFKNVDNITHHLYQIKKLQYVIETIAFEDRVAKRELQNILDYEKYLLNNAINEDIFSNNGNVIWIYKGECISIENTKKFKQLISQICKDYYPSTPIVRNELFNKHKISSAISLARVNLLNALLEHSSEVDFGFKAEMFPPEKTIYYTLLKQTGIHRQDENGMYILDAPTNGNIITLWEACESFIQSTLDKPKKLSELIKILKSRPFRLKQGFIDFWVPIFLYIKQQDYSLYNKNGAYVMNITKEVFELLQKHIGEFSIKALNVTGVKLEFFKKYTSFLRQGENIKFNSKSFIQTFRPYLQFYRSLDTYAKTTYKFDNPSTAKFRDALANAKDPEKTFFEELPKALGYKEESLLKNEDFAAQYDKLIKEAVHELRICYDNFINRIEYQVKEQLGIVGDFDEYKILLENRYSSVRVSLLPPKSRIFYERVMAPSDNKREFYEKICNVIFDKRLDQTTDSEEDILINKLLFLFRELERYTDVSNTLSTSADDDEIYNFEMVSNIGKSKESQTYRLPNTQKSRASEIENKINEALSGDIDLDVCVLLRMLNEKLGGNNG